ncbi:putative quinol monooxygenase [Undibacterium sp. Di27W]|uniref:putative quinol monooxygenase n=1 Tax=Undibacterium sp. Di27W TaxID=3413036 RepID=UPI003BF237A3
MKNTLTIVAHVRAKRGMEQLMISEQMRLVAATKNSLGCLHYELHRSSRDKVEVTFVEEWETRELWQAHMESQYIAAFRTTAGHIIEDFALYELHQIA